LYKSVRKACSPCQEIAAARFLAAASRQHFYWAKPNLWITLSPPPNLENTRRANLQLKCDNLLITLKLKVMQITKIWKSYIMYKCITSSKTCRCIPPRMNYFTIIINFSKPKLGALA
jgi:hypothetical protein